MPPRFAVLLVNADEALRAAIAATHGTPAFIARDAVRKPYEELLFLGLRLLNSSSSFGLPQEALQIERSEEQNSPARKTCMP